MNLIKAIPIKYYFITGLVFSLVGTIIMYYTLYESGIWTLEIGSCSDFWLNEPFLDDVSILSHIGFALNFLGIFIMFLTYVLKSE